ncbi:hypothetical protein BKA70DRAFT_1406240 [Coprinopsis sp. MPI-PUGE-AT-0042]|nr:hypothetical protein BKA70DRAFT_1406240 [Coprinopsis sp. MPI-PUGE-AT-0042]
MTRTELVDFGVVSLRQRSCLLSQFRIEPREKATDKRVHFLITSLLPASRKLLTIPDWRPRKEHESVHTPSFRPGPGANLEAGVCRREGSSPAAIQDPVIPAPSYGLFSLGRCPIHGIRRLCKQPVGAQSHRTRNKRQRTELCHDFSGDRPERRLTDFLRLPSPFNSNIEVAAWPRSVFTVKNVRVGANTVEHTLDVG